MWLLCDVVLPGMVIQMDFLRQYVLSPSGAACSVLVTHCAVLKAECVLQGISLTSDAFAVNCLRGSPRPMGTMFRRRPTSQTEAGDQDQDQGGVLAGRGELR